MFIYYFFFFLILLLLFLLLLLLPCIFHLDFLQIIVFIWNNFLFGVCFFSAVPMLFSTKYNRLILSSTLPSFVFGLSCWVAVIVLWGGVLFLPFISFVCFLLFSGPLFFEIFSRYICEFFYYYCYYSLLRYKNFTQFIIYLLKYYISLK